MPEEMTALSVDAYNWVAVFGMRNYQIGEKELQFLPLKVIVRNIFFFLY